MSDTIYQPRFCTDSWFIELERSALRETLSMSPSMSTGRKNFCHKHPVDITSGGWTMVVISLFLRTIPTTVTVLPSCIYLPKLDTSLGRKKGWFKPRENTKLWNWVAGYPSSRRKRRGSSERFLSLNHFLRGEERILHGLVVLTSWLSTTKGITLQPEPALTMALRPDFLSVM